MKKYAIAICIATAGVITCTAFFICAAKPKEPQPVDYTIYVYDDGSAQIEAGSINGIIQTHEDMTLDGMTLRAGTIILPGNGNKIYYEYPRREQLGKETENEN